MTPAVAARADVSSWFYAGGGPTWLSEQGSSFEVRPTMQLDVGMGTAPSGTVIIGALARSTTYFGAGTDLGLALRAATGDFARGGFGLALDAGAYKRWWGMGSAGPMGSLQLGAPFGLQLSLNAAFGTDEHLRYGATFGIDLLRLTVCRVSGEQWWPNPRPAYRPPSTR
jgi:hypothetical protein